MSKKQDMIATLQGRQPSKAVPLWEMEFHLWDAVSSRRLILGREFHALSPAEQEQALYTNAEIMLSVAEELGFAAISIPGPFWEIGPGIPAYYWLLEDARFSQVGALREVGGDDVMLIAESGGVMSMPTGGIEDFFEYSYRLVKQPKEMDRLAQEQFAYGVKYATKFLDLGVEAVLTSSDWADSERPFFRPEQMERFIWPYLRRWAEAVKEMGGYTILHSDGNIAPHIQDIAASGIHAWQAVDPSAGLDIRKIKKAVQGRICLCGNVDCSLLVSGTPEQIYEVTRDLLLDCKAGGGLVLGASNAVQKAVPVENYKAMAQAWKEHAPY